MTIKKTYPASSIEPAPEFTFNFRQKEKKEQRDKAQPSIKAAPIGTPSFSEKNASQSQPPNQPIAKNDKPSPPGSLVSSVEKIKAKKSNTESKKFIASSEWKHKENFHTTKASSTQNMPKTEIKEKGKNNRFISLAASHVDWRKNPKIDIPANISNIEKAPNNYLYIAENEKGIVKVGVTKNNPYERVESFSQYYPDKFRLVTYFNIKNLDRVNVETFFHEILNSQFLNINYLSRVLPQINESHKKIVNERLNGYTELFVENKTILKNLLIFLNLIDVIDLKLYDIEEVSKIKDYQLGDVKVFKRTKKDLIQKEKNKISPIKPVINNKQNLLLKNAKFFFSAIDYKDLKHLSFEIDANKILFKLKSKELLITNFIYTNLAPDLTQALIKTKIYRSVHFTNLVEHISNLRKLNTRVSTQYQDKKLLNGQSQVPAVNVKGKSWNDSNKGKGESQENGNAVFYTKRSYKKKEKNLNQPYNNTNSALANISQQNAPENTNQQGSHFMSKNVDKSNDSFLSQVEQNPSMKKSWACAKSTLPNKPEVEVLKTPDLDKLPKLVKQKPLRDYYYKKRKI